MPTWSGILKELGKTTDGISPPDFDLVRRKYMAALRHHTGRSTILYASGWLQKDDIPEHLITIGDEDIQALMEVTSGLGSGSDLDLILHSPGGSVESAEALVAYLRSRFSHIRVIVPNLAMSAATMICCAADELVLGKHSFLGPTDPQVILPTPLGTRFVPMQAILNQFDRAVRDIEDSDIDPAKLAVWMPMLVQYGPDLLAVCEASLSLSRDMVHTWLRTYMLRNDHDRAKHIAEWLADHKTFKSHGRHISRDELKYHGLIIKDLERDDRLQDLVLSVYHATTHTFSGTGAVKIVENHTGRAFIKNHTPMPLQFGRGLEFPS